MDLSQAVERVLGDVGADGGPVQIEDLHRLSGGASRDTWSFSARSDDVGWRRLILQRVRPGLAMGGPTLDVEDRLLQAAAQAGVPVPEVVADAAACADSIGDARITGHVDGETLGPRIVRDDRYGHAREQLARQCAHALAAIHSIDPAALESATSGPTVLESAAALPSPPAKEDAVMAGLVPVDTLGRIREGLDLLDEARPAFELALCWLQDHRPPGRPTAVVHGDFRVGNFIVGEDGLRAVLDWELAHLGDPLEDLGWLCVRAWRFGGAGEVGGFAPLDDLVDAYAEATGTAVDLDHVRWWIVAGTLTWGLICAVQARRHLDGHVSSVELATIGRRVCETEYDLLHLLGIDAPADGDDGSVEGAGSDARQADGREADGGNGGDRHAQGDDGAAEDQARDIHWAATLHGRPTAAELVDAVRSHLIDEVAPTQDGAASFALKVAVNALAMVERELTLRPHGDADVAERLASRGIGDETELAAAIRRREVGPESPEVTAVVRALVVDRVRVANPKWLLPPDRDRSAQRP